MVEADIDGMPGGPTRRSVLTGSGAGLLAIVPAVVATTSAKSAPATDGQQAAGSFGISARDFGAAGDGNFHPLADRFSTLAEARAVYPFATRMDQSLDWAGIQAAINKAEQVGGGLVLIPTGRFIISDTLRLPSNITLLGESRTGSIIDNQNWPLHAPQFTNKDPVAFLYVTIRNLTLHGGTHALKVDVSREVSGIVIEGITTALQSEANIDFSSLQTCVVRDCWLMDGQHGVTVRGFPCNSVHIINTRIGSHSDASIRLRGVDGFVMFGGSIEGGVTPGKATIDIETGGAYAQAVEFSNVYFENTHTTLLRSRGTKVLSFVNCKFTGTGTAPGGGIGAYRFDCDKDIITFANNFFHVPMTGPDNMLVTGNNHGLRTRGTVWRQRDASRAVLTSRRFATKEAFGGLFYMTLGGGQGESSERSTPFSSRAPTVRFSASRCRSTCN